MKIASYIFGAIAMLSLLLAYQQNRRERLIIHKLVADVCWAIHYFLLGAYGGVVPNIVGIFREIVFLKRDTSKPLKQGAGRFAGGHGRSLLSRAVCPALSLTNPLPLYLNNI